MATHAFAHLPQGRPPPCEECEGARVIRANAGAMTKSGADLPFFFFCGGGSVADQGPVAISYSCCPNEDLLQSGHHID
jgi:hypothetical protein